MLWVFVVRRVKGTFCLMEPERSVSQVGNGLQKTIPSTTSRMWLLLHGITQSIGLFCRVVNLCGKGLYPRAQGFR